MSREIYSLKASSQQSKEAYTSAVDELLNTTNQVQVSIRVQVPNIARVEPTELEDLLAGLGVVHVAIGRIRSPDTNLAADTFLLDHPLVVQDRHLMAHGLPY